MRLVVGAVVLALLVSGCVRQASVSSSIPPASLIASTTVAADQDPPTDAFRNGRLPDGTEYRFAFDPPLDIERVSGISAAVVVDLSGDPAAQQTVGCTQPCPRPVIGIATFQRGRAPETRYENGAFILPSGGWTMRIALYGHILPLWGGGTEAFLSAAISPIGGPDNALPGYTLAPPLAWATDEEIPLQMQVQYETFVVQRGCGPASVACSSNQRVQIIPADAVFGRAPPWDPQRRATIDTRDP